MNFSKLPYTVIGLLAVTFCLVGVLSFQGNYLQANLESETIDQEINNLLEKHRVGSDTTTQKTVEKAVASVTKEPIKANTVLAKTEPVVANEPVNEFAADQPESQAVMQDSLVANSVELTHHYECSESSFEKDKYQFEVITPEVSYQVAPGQSFTTVIYVKNTGTNNWCGELIKEEAGRLRLGTALPQDRQSQILAGNAYRITMQAPEGIILPGETAAFVVDGVAPMQNGIYREFFSPVVESVGWFNNIVINLDLYVGSYTEADFDKLYYLERTGNTNEFNLEDKLTVNIDLNTQTEYVYKGNKLVHSYLVSSGAYKTPTPVGVYEVYNKQELRIAGGYPAYRMPYWIGLKRPGGSFRGYGLHALPYLGNNKNSSYFWKEAVSHLGTRVSHGCVRRSDNDAEWLYHIVNPDNTKIEVFYSFDPNTFVADAS